MSIQTANDTRSKVKKEGIFVLGAPRKIIKRSSYSWQKASYYKPVFDKIIELHQSVFVPCPANLAPNSLRCVLADSLLWLIDNFEEPWRDPLKDKYTRNDYAALKGQTRQHMTEDGVQINFLASISDTQAAMVASITEVNSTANSNWQYQITVFLANPSESILVIKNLYLTKSDREWLDKILENFSSTEIQHKITPTSIEIVK